MPDSAVQNTVQNAQCPTGDRHWAFAISGVTHHEITSPSCFWFLVVTLLVLGRHDSDSASSYFRSQLASFFLVLLRRQELLVDLGYYYVIWVYHFGYVDCGYFA